jgi:hypothetical protein
VTEAEWLACDHPAELLHRLCHASLGGLAIGHARPSDRKLRLFACACCRQAWRRLTDPRARKAVEVAERYAEGQAQGSEELTACWRDSLAVGLGANFAAHCAAALDPQEATRNVLDRLPPEPGTRRGLLAARLRDIAGNPFRPPPVAPAGPAWAARGPTRGVLASLAQAAYDERALPAGTLDLQRLAILADALEEGGCADAELLWHLRAPGPHVRGCWAIDLVLGKE